MNKNKCEPLKTILFWIIFCISAPLPIVGGLLLIVCGALGLIDIDL